MADEIDINRISAAIQISDIMVGDKVRKYELTETGLSKKYATNIFCGVPTDVKALEAYIGDIVTS